MIRLTAEQLQKKIDFIQHYKAASNAAEGSRLDANANVTLKNIATLEAEINKDINIQINRTLVAQKICELFGVELASEYVRQIESHEIYVHDETSLKPYCASISMYPLLLKGLRDLGGESAAPQHLQETMERLPVHLDQYHKKNRSCTPLGGRPLRRALRDGGRCEGTQ